MSTTKHTPGPWHFDAHYMTVQKQSNDMEDGEGNPIIELIAGIKTGEIADARLIAAAPELLEALQDAMKVAIHEEHPFRSWHNNAKAAIAKATGTNA